MKRQHVFAANIDKRLTEIESKIFAGKEFMNRINEDLRNDVSLIKHNVSEGEESLSVFQRETELVIDEMKQQIAGNKFVIQELSTKLENDQRKISTINGAPVFECGTWDRFELSCYKFFDEEVEWEEAVVRCRLEDAYLIEVDVSAEHAYALNLTKSRGVGFSEYVWNRKTGPWLGASDIQTEGKWVWERSGRTMNRTYQGWYDGEPNGKTVENCLHLFEVHAYQWNDAPCSKKKPYVCEKYVTVK